MLLCVVGFYGCMPRQLFLFLKPLNIICFITMCDMFENRHYSRGHSNTVRFRGMLYKRCYKDQFFKNNAENIGDRHITCECNES